MERILTVVDWFRKPLWRWGPTPLEIIGNIGMWACRLAGLVLTIFGIGGLMKDRIEPALLIGPALVVAAQILNWYVFGDSSVYPEGR